MDQSTFLVTLITIGDDLENTLTDRLSVLGD
jgi:hypothetical protein